MTEPRLEPVEPQQAAEPWSPPEYAPLPIDHPALGLACGVCLKPLRAGDVTVPVPKRAPTVEEMATPEEFMTIEAVLVHSLCYQIAAALVARQKGEKAQA